MLLNQLRKIKAYSIAIPLFYYYKYFGSDNRANDKVVVLNIRNVEFKRYLYLFVKFLHLEGYSIYIGKDFPTFYKLYKDQYINFLFREKIIKAGNPPANRNVKYIDDSVLCADYFSYPYLPHLSKTSYFVPMQQHPLMYHTGWWNEPLADARRKKSLFMAGNFDEQSYTPIEGDGLFKTISRLKVHEHLNTNGLLYYIQDMPQLRTFLDDERIDEKVILINRLKTDVPMNELRHVLTRFDFYFALPGVVMPFSHNIIEAMSVGCIPFLQDEYAAMFKPSLINGKNALTFYNEEDLQAKITSLLNLNKSEIKRMQDEVLNFYYAYLTPESVVKALEDINFNKIYLQAEHYSVDLMKAAQTSLTSFN